MWGVGNLLSHKKAGEWYVLSCVCIMPGWPLSEDVHRGQGMGIEPVGRRL